MTETSTFTDAHIALIADLIKRPDVQSVSFNYDDFAVWKLLADEQKSRTKISGQHPQKAFGLSCPDSGLTFNAAELGAYVHVPYEGAADADLFVNPPWRGYLPRLSKGGGGLYAAFGKPMHLVLVKGSGPEIEGATRTHIDGWTLYQSTMHYVPLGGYAEVVYPAGESFPDTGPTRPTFDD